MSLKKILIANRGEIARRIMRTCRKLGVSTVAVYSEADRTALHTQEAEEAICLGPSPSSESYLRGDKIIAAAIQSGAQAIHPGYGFLSENADFAQKVIAAGLTFIGPNESAIEAMGNKLIAKANARKFNVPLVPGSDQAVSYEEALLLAKIIGYPVLIKAAAGGGGKGMRIVKHEVELKEAFERASSEAQSSFADGSVFIEKYISNPKHIEIQILGDHYGQIIHLGERECSIQRRHQKVLEESPSPMVDPDLRHQLGQAAINVGKSCGYTNAGTVEFIMDETGKFYFLEMNTRLQVEHPVTEMVTGLDLVELQIRIAEGKKLPVTQEQIRWVGHAIELRVYAEDIYHSFIPSTGVISSYKKPDLPGVRLDDACAQGSEISVYYDPMIAKLIAYGHNRQEAIMLLNKAIDAYRIEGVKTTLPFGKFVLNHPIFLSGQANTGFVNDYFKPEAVYTNGLKEIGQTAISVYLTEFSKIRIPNA